LFSQSWGKARQLWPKQMIYTHKWLDIKNNVWHSTQTSKNNTYTLSNLFWLNHLYFNQDNPSIKISRESLAPEMLLCFLLLLSTPTYSISAYNWDLTAKDYKANDMANHNKQRNQCVDESKNMVTSILMMMLRRMWVANKTWIKIVQWIYIQWRKIEYTIGCDRLGIRKAW
jgi:hypothetical protein